MTMTEIARLAGVSVSTVSKAFSGDKDISEATRNRVFDVAKQNDCYSKYIKTFKYKYVVAVISPEFQSGCYTQQLTYFSEELKKRNALMLVAEDNFNREERKDLVSYFSFISKVDGIIIYGNIDAEYEYKTPIIAIGKTDLFNSVQMSYENALCDAVVHLKENGHTDIAYIGEPLTVYYLECFKNIMNKYNMPIKDEYVINTMDTRFEFAGYEAMNELLSLDKPPTAVITAYDYIAFGAIKSIKEHGLRIPEDISIIGRDDVKECDYLDIPLTTITPYSKDLCEIIISELFDKIENKTGKKTKTIKVSAEFLKRSTVGKSPR